jgi:hypothetical protein
LSRELIGSPLFPKNLSKGICSDSTGHELILLDNWDPARTKSDHRLTQFQAMASLNLTSESDQDRRFEKRCPNGRILIRKQPYA